MVQARLMPLLARLAAEGLPTGAITHKGVLRAILALATGWDMLGEPPVKLMPAALHLFELDARGAPRLVRPNLALTR
jgi:probable phosphoglycerate mutase